MAEKRSTKKEWNRVEIKSVLAESFVIIFISLLLLILQNGIKNFSAFFNFHSLLTLVGGLMVWFLNRFILGQILQSKINSNTITRRLPVELLAVSIVITSAIYILIFVAGFITASYVTHDYFKNKYEQQMEIKHDTVD